MHLIASLIRLVNRRRAALHFLGLTAVMLLLAACISADDPNVSNNDTNGDSDTDIEEDTDDEEDVGTDTGEDDADADPCGACCPGEVRCSDAATVQTCREDGEAFEVTSTCGVDKICTEGECVDEPECEQGEQQCTGSNSIMTCSALGQFVNEQDCPEGEACVNDECTSGSPTGESCDAGDDCAGGVCRCGDGESCDLGQAPYCTGECSADSCSGNEICWESGDVAAAGYDHCLVPCGTGSCPLSECKEVLTGDGGSLGWESACLPPEMKAVGDFCDTADACLSDTCESDFFDVGYCTQRCEESGCPSGSACVDQEGNEEFWCFPECDNSDECPLGGFPISCGNRGVHGGGIARVCTK